MAAAVAALVGTAVNVLWSLVDRVSPFALAAFLVGLLGIASAARIVRSKILDPPRHPAWQMADDVWEGVRRSNESPSSHFDN